MRRSAKAWPSARPGARAPAGESLGCTRKDEAIDSCSGLPSGAA